MVGAPRRSRGKPGLGAWLLSGEAAVIFWNGTHVATEANIASASPHAPNPTSLSRRYAQALLAVADDRRAAEPGALDRIAGDLEGLAGLWNASSAFRVLVGDPRLDGAKQRAGAFALLERAGVGVEVRNLVGVMIANRRLSQLPAVAAAFRLLLADRRGEQTAEVISALPLTSVQLAQLEARLIEAGYSKLNLQPRVDASILGGLIVRIGSRLFDSSIKSKLQRLQYAMKGAA
jgi:F-type H+-transporting ATPase subunit delta